jgi:hypothetical protein
MSGFFEQNAGRGGPPIMKWNGNEAKYLIRDGDVAFNDQDFALDVLRIVAGYIKFGAKGEQPERRMGAIYPKDEAPKRDSLGDTDKSKWPKGRFSKEAEDPWTPVVELPLRHRETGEEYVLSLQTKTSIGAAQDLFQKLRSVPSGYDPVIKLGAGPMKTKVGHTHTGRRVP